MDFKNYFEENLGQDMTNQIYQYIDTSSLRMLVKNYPHLDVIQQHPHYSAEDVFVYACQNGHNHIASVLFKHVKRDEDVLFRALYGSSARGHTDIAMRILPYINVQNFENWLKREGRYELRYKMYPKILVSMGYLDVLEFLNTRGVFIMDMPYDIFNPVNIKIIEYKTGRPFQDYLNETLENGSEREKIEMLRSAARNGIFDIVRLMVEDYGIGGPNDRSPIWLALYDATTHGNLEIGRYLLYDGIENDQFNDVDAVKALTAVVNNDMAAVEKYVELLHWESVKGMFTLAYEYGNLDVMNFLLESRGIWEIPEKTFQEISQNGDLRMLQYLYSAGLIPNDEERLHDLLDMACMFGGHDAIIDFIEQILVDNGFLRPIYWI